MRGRTRILQAAVLLSLAAASAGLSPVRAAPPGAEAKAILKQLDSPKGICAVLGDQEARLAVALARASELVVYVQLPDAQAVAAARREALEAGMLNGPVYIEQGGGQQIHLADNLADAVVVLPSAGSVPREEVLRVLRPGGKGLLGAKTLVKPPPEGIDDWSHPYHAPDNNPQSADRVARAPYLTQFLAKPWYCPMPEVTVASGGRIFKAFGSRAFKRPQWPMLNTLIAVNGYNGTILWTRPLDPDFMIHRNTMIATPETLYLADAASCKLLDAATGELAGEITAPEGISDGPVWKWMALADGVLYALVGEQEPPGDALKGEPFRGAGWPWWEIRHYAWGFGRTIVAFEPKTNKVLWYHRESEPLDTRAMCMKANRIFFSSLGNFVGCLDAKTGELIWKNDDRQVAEAINARRPAQRAVWGFASSAYAKCSDRAVYFAGPQQTRLVALSAEDGKLLWQYPEEGNFQLVLRDDGLYAMGSDHPSHKFDPLTGASILQLPNRAACTRATGSVDRVFVRGQGTRCWDVAAGRWLHISPMRPACHDGVVIADGHLYWGPWLCGCNLSLIGIVSVGPAGNFDYTAEATEADRLQAATAAPRRPTPLPQTSGDWPTFRKDNARAARTEVAVASKVGRLWEFSPGNPNTPTAPVAVGDLVLTSGSDGVVRALDAASGALRWSAPTGGRVNYPPSIADGRALVGSGDGWIYAFEAASGRLLWRFRGAPVERKIPVYGLLSSTWPIGSGVLVEDGVAYAAAGIANYDGTHVYALDAATGKIRWQNNTSGETAGGQGDGVSVQGHLLASGGKLYLAAGNRVRVASYDLATGAFRPAPPVKISADRRGPRGKDLFLTADGKVGVTGMFPLYTRPEDVHFIEHADLPCSAGRVGVITAALGVLLPEKGKDGKPKPLWAARPFNENAAVAVTQNAVVVAGLNRNLQTPNGVPRETYGLTALGLRDGKPLWRHQLPAGPVSWGLAVDRNGRILVSLRDGRVVCFGPAG